MPRDGWEGKNVNASGFKILFWLNMFVEGDAANTVALLLYALAK